MSARCSVQFLSCLLFCIITVNSTEQLPSVIQVKNACPKDRVYCAAKARKGTCLGKTRGAKVLRNNCECSCDYVLSKRIMTCCKAVGVNEMRFCLPLCRYNTTFSELTSGLGFKCVSQLTVWAYCASDANDNTACCRSLGVPKECLSFCKGDVPTCDLQSIFTYQPCLKHLGTIVQCQLENLSRKPKWDSEWNARCEWEG